jgi:hypothetical protein
MKKTIQVICLFFLILINNGVKAQNNSYRHYPTLEEKVTKADAVVEGEIIETRGFLKDGEIYTSATLMISKIFKGHIKDTLIEVICKGGTYNGQTYASSHVRRLFKEDDGIFYLSKNDTIKSGDSLISFTCYGNPANVTAYDYSSSEIRANGHEGHYANLETDLFQKIESLTGQKRKAMGLNRFEKEDLFKFKKKIEVKAYKTTSGPCDQENGLCTIIDYAYANVSLSANGQILDFDIVSRSPNLPS